MSAFITVSTTVTVTAVTAATAATDITAAVIISGLLLSQLLLVGRLDLSYGQQKDTVEHFYRIKDKVTCALLEICFPFSILLLLFFHLAILLQYRTLGDNVLGRGGMQWGKMGHCLMPWYFPVYIEPSASLLLDITTYRNTFFPFFLLTAFLLIDYD